MTAKQSIDQEDSQSMLTLKRLKSKFSVARFLFLFSFTDLSVSQVTVPLHGGLKTCLHNIRSAAMQPKGYYSVQFLPAKY